MRGATAIFDPAEAAARYRAGETVLAIATSYRATERTIRAALRKRGVVIRPGYERVDHVAVAVAAKTHHRRVKFRLHPDDAKILHALMDESGRTEQDILGEAIRGIAAK